MNTQFIFNEQEFENEAFSGPAFVSRYRKVVSLDELREQLRLFTESLKDRLYNIINSEYQDFITIATKLDGVDGRVEHLRKPLVELRLNLSNLHDGLVGNIKTIESKLKERNQVSARKRVVESCLQGMKRLDEAEKSLSLLSKQPDNCAVASRRSRLIKNISKCQSLEAPQPSAEKFKCSEVERVAHSLSDVSSLLASLESLEEVADSHRDLVRSLQTKCLDLQQTVVKWSEHRMGKYFESLRSDQQSFSMKSFLHCLRALLVLKKGDVCERALSQTVVIPLAQACLTSGRVDSGERGSFRGLADALTDVLTSLDSFSTTFARCEELPGVDLLVNSVWKVVGERLLKKFPEMFSSGIAATFSSCYGAFHKFCNNLAGLSGRERAEQVLMRIRKTSLFHTIAAKWNVLLYVQLRSTEVFARLDAVIETVRSHGISSSLLTSSEVNTVKAIVVPTDKAKSVTTVAQAASTLMPLSESLSNQERQDISAELNISMFASNFVRRYCIEVGTCFHPAVVLEALFSKFVALSMRCLLSLELQVATLADVNSSRLCLSAEENVGKPSKSSSSLSVLSIDELVMLAADMARLSGWVDGVLLPFASRVLGSRSDVAKQKLRLCFREQQRRFLDLKSAIFMKLAGVVAADCKRALNAVKQIAAKYRMTNKPPPETASPFVETILQPLKSFCGKHDDVLKEFFPRGQWDRDMVEDVAAAYLVQTQALMETVKSMDSALQRRSKLRQAASPHQGLSDSEKIFLQSHLDVNLFVREVNSLGISSEDVTSMQLLLAEVADAAKLLT